MELWHAITIINNKVIKIKYTNKHISGITHTHLFEWTIVIVPVQIIIQNTVQSTKVKLIQKRKVKKWWPYDDCCSCVTHRIK